MMTRFLKKFVSAENGAVTIDWVVICAGVVAIAVAAVISIQTGSTDLTSDAGTYMSKQDPNL